jgi:uroporphyrinogen decarboxylase
MALELTPRERFLRAAAARPVDHPPVWLMRQAGRCLPEYRELRKRHTFLELAQTPELAAEVTLQPIRRFDFDAAVIFSDILVIPEAMGVPYDFRDGGGIAMKKAVASLADIKRLKVDGVAERLLYVGDALRLARRELGDRTALLGFTGSPWTLACFLLEGGSSHDFTRARSLVHADPKLLDALLSRLTDAVIDYVDMQIAAGADAIQIFDTLGGLLPDAAFARASLKWMRKIARAIRKRVPVIIFSRGRQGGWRAIAEAGADVVGVDWAADLAAVAASVPRKTAVQGNLDPTLLLAPPAAVKREVRALLKSMKGRDGHILNLGHGVPPDARLDAIEALIDTAREHRATGRAR